MSENPNQSSTPKFISKKTLTTTPTTWFPECKYCQTTNMGHEQELLGKASLFCKKSAEHHFQEFLTSEFDTLDHSKLNPTGQIEILNAVHDKTGCDCLTSTITTINEQISPTTTNPTNPPNIFNQEPSTNLLNPKPSTNPTSKPNRTNHHKPPRPSTLIDRLKIGPHRQETPKTAK